MNLSGLMDRRDLVWTGSILTAAAAALFANLAGLLVGITTVIPHLLYVPVVLAAYRYPRRGAVIAAVIGGLYVLEVIIVAGTAKTLFFEALVRMLVIIAIGWLI